MSELIRKFTQELDECETILDLGVGTGRFAKPLQDAGFEVTGIDIGRRMIDKAKEKDVSNLLLSDARFLPFKEGTFDAAISIHVLHLVKEWEMALQEACRVTRDFLFSLLTSRRDPIREAYDHLLKKYGYERRVPGKSEQELRDLVNPVKSLFVCSYDTYADQRLINLSQGTSSSSWHIPEDVNRRIVEQLRSQFADTTFRQDLHLIMWKIDDLKVIL